MREGATPQVSVITPAYNAAALIAQTIESVRCQSYSHWEMVVVDDCSADSTRDIVEEKARQDTRIRPLKMESNSGVAAARNTGMDAARGRYIAFLDSDDLWLPSKLEEQLDFMERRKAAFSFTSYGKIGPDGKILGDTVRAPERIGYDSLLKNTIIGCLTVMLDRELLESFGISNLHMGSSNIRRGQEDYTLWFRILRSGIEAQGLQRELARYRILESSLSRNKLKAAHRMWKVYREVEGLSLPYSAWCFSNYALRAYIKSRG